MAQIILSGEELVGILTANALVPDHVTDIETHGEEIRVKVRTPWPVLRSVRVGVKFMSFEEGHVVLQLMTNRFIDTFDWLVDRMFESLQLADYGGRWEYPRLYVDVNKLLQQHVQGVQVETMVFEDDCFRITTTHPVLTAPASEAAAEEEPAP